LTEKTRHEIQSIRDDLNKLSTSVDWLNTTISGSTGFTLVELMFNDIHPDIFKVKQSRYRPGVALRVPAS